MTSGWFKLAKIKCKQHFEQLLAGIDIWIFISTISEGKERGNILLIFLPIDCLYCVLFYGAKYYYQDSGGARRNTTQRPTKTPFLPRRTRKFYIMWRLVEKGGWVGVFAVRQYRRFFFREKERSLFGVEATSTNCFVLPSVRMSSLYMCTKCIQHKMRISQVTQKKRRDRFF